MKISIVQIHYIIGKAGGYIEVNNGNKYLVFTCTDKKVLTKCTKLWDKIKHPIETINEGKKGEYENNFMEIKFNSDDNLPLNKVLKLHILTVIVKSVSEEDSIYHPQVF